MTDANSLAVAEDTTPLLYVDVGKYFSGTNAIILDANSIIQWLFTLAHHDDGLFETLVGRLATQFNVNGIHLCRTIYYPVAHEKTSIFERILKDAIQMEESTIVSHATLHRWYLEASAQCPLLLSVQAAHSFSHFIAPLKYGINVALLSERSLLPSDRLYCFLYLSTPHALKLCSESDEIAQMMKEFKVSKNLKAEDQENLVTLEELEKIDMSLLDFSGRIVDLLPATFKFEKRISYDELYGSQEGSRVYEQIEKDLMPLLEEYEYNDEKKARHKKLDPKIAEARKNQKFMSSIHTYASSLQGATSFFRNIIVSASSTTDEKDVSRGCNKREKPVKEAYSKGAIKSRKPEKKSKAQLIKEENENRLKEQELVKYRNILATAIENCSAVRSIREKLKILDSLKIAQGSDIPEMNVAFLLAKMEVHVGAWKEDMLTKADLANSQEDADFINAVAIMEKLYQIYDEYLDAVRIDQIELSIIPALCLFGFTDAAEMFIRDCSACKAAKGDPFTPVQIKKLTTSIVTASHAVGKYKIRMSYSRFQMLFCGHFFIRSLDSSRDDRVLFTPDRWQVELLDAVDRGESALICAPTSSGKTFICYYAMEKILRSNNEDVVIYVAPNKALMNQVAADVYARFNHKTYPTNSNMHLFGLLSDRDVLHPFDCQVLVTFPEVFEKFALSPLHGTDLWLKRVKYVILDEIHTIGEEGKGAAWEKIILLARCPILALSATVGNRAGFWEWLCNIQSRINLPCRLIEQHERFSDLKRYVYDAHQENNIDLNHFESIKWTAVKRKTQKASRIIQMHPLVSLSRSDMTERALPSDYQFLPGDVIRLVDEMKRTLGGKICPPEILDLLDVQKQFGSSFRISKKEARIYETRIKESLRQLIKGGILSSDSITNLIEKLCGPAIRAFQATERAILVGEETEAFANEISNSKLSENTEAKLPEMITTNTKSFLGKTLLSLLVDLANEDKLPVILFHFDRQECSHLAAALIESLEWAEQCKRARRSKDEKGRINELEKHQKMQKRLRDAEKKVTKDSWMEESLQEETMADLSAGLNRLDPDLAFQDARYKIRDSELDSLIEEKYKLTRRMTTPLEKTLLQGLRRGIGVHHRGVPKKYLELVEHLFRLRHLQVVIATSTLALGINMPCKSVVFAGDDLALTPIEYRQMAGRAGRRGYDDLGHVIFWGLPKAKTSRLITSALPSIQAAYPVHATFCLQLCHLQSGSQLLSSNCGDASRELASPRLNSKDSLLTVVTPQVVNEFTKVVLERHLKYPLCSLASPIDASALTLHFYLLLDYLTRSGLLVERTSDNISRLPSPSGSASTGETQLFPSIYARLPLMLPADGDGSFLLVMLFRLGWLDALCSDYYESPDRILKALMHLFVTLFQPRFLPENHSHPSAFLEPLPEELQVELENYNISLLRYLAAYSTATKDIFLEQTILGLKEKIPDITSMMKDDWFNAGALVLSAPHFHALIRDSKKNDNISDITSRDAILPNGLGFPFFSMPPRVVRNNYIYAYYLHGDTARIAHENKVPERDLWQDLYDMNNVLKQTAAFADSLLPKVEIHEATVQALKELASTFDKKFKRMWA